MVYADIALPRGHALREYRIEYTLGIGGFGLTYLAIDGNLNLRVAIKEYLPGDLALRSDDQSVQPKSGTALDRFNWGRSRFLDESRTLASFRHPNIVRVMRFFEANQTAYMVMEFVDGKPLNEWIKDRRPLSERQVIAIVLPLLEGVGLVHRGGYLHRDIKPGNILMREDGSPVLLDFGSARLATANTERTAIVSPGFAPLEQYHSLGNQGPWTDLYAIGAVLYWMVTGDKPMDAPARMPRDMMKPAIQAGDRSRYGAGLLNAIDWALAPAEEARPQSVAELARALQDSMPAHSGDLSTIFPDATRQPGPAAAPATAPLDGDTLKRIVSDLADSIGPLASLIVKSAEKRATTITQLVETVAGEISDAKARAAFVKKFSSADRPAPSQPPQSIPSQGPLDAAMLVKAETELARHIGVIARIHVRRAAARARDEAEFYSLLAASIEDPAAKSAFLKKMTSVSGRE